jgi:NADPH:quinone reductase-like Zn-dependent oxidoreductase
LKDLAQDSFDQAGPERIFMKAVVYTEYGSPDVLRLEEVEKPTPSDDEVLVEVHAASVNSWDWDLLRGTPFFNRLGGPLKPQYKILGCDIAGRIEAVGRNVQRFQPGDAVFGDLCRCGWGGFAEYVCARENALAPKPASITFEEAAAVPQVGVLALQGLRDKRDIQPGQKVLINGAGGGVGTLAIQIAKTFGAEVTGVDSAMKLDMVRSLGADHVIDYSQEDFTNSGQCYDLILDVVAHRSLFDCERALSPEGIYVIIGGSNATIFQATFLGPLMSLVTGKKIGLLMHKPNKGLDFLTELLETAKLKPVIDRCYSLSEVPEALRYYGEGYARGKVVITVEHNDN